MNNDWFSGPFQPPQQTAPQQVAAPQPKKNGGIKGFLQGIGHTIVDPAAYLVKADIVNPIRQSAAQISGNKVAMKNADRASNENLGFGEKGTDIGGALEKFAGNSAQVGLNLVNPESSGFMESLLKQGALGAASGGASALSNNGSLEDTLTGAASGGAFGAATGGVGNIFGKVLGKGAKVVDNKVAQVAENKGIADTLKDYEPFKGVPQKARESGKLGENIDMLKQFGMEPTPENMKKAAGLVTGDNGAVSGIMRELVQNHKTPINMEGFMQHVTGAIDDNSPLLGEAFEKGSKGNSLYKNLQKTLQNKIYGGEGSLTNEATAERVFDTIKDVDKQVARYSKSAPGTEGEAIGDVYKQAKKSLEDRLYNDSGFNKSVAEYRIAPEDEATIRKLVAKQGGTDELAEHIINGVNTAKSGQELRSIQAPFVKSSQLAGAADKATGGALPKAPGSDGQGLLTGRGGRYNALELAGLLGGNPIQALPLAANIAQSVGTKTTESAVLKGAKNLVGKARSIGKEGKTNNFLTSMVTRAGAENLGQPQDQTQTPQVEQSQLPDTGLSTGGLSSGLGGSGGFGQTQSASQYPQENLLSDVQRDPKNMDAYITLYKLLNPEPSASSTAAQQKATIASANAQDTLGTIENSFNAAGGGQGKVGGFLTNLMGKVGANSGAATYNDTATALAASLYKALGNTGTISDKDQQLIAKLIPKTTDTSTTAQSKIDQLKSLLSQAQQNAQYATAGAGSGSNIYQ